MIIEVVSELEFFCQISSEAESLVTVASSDAWLCEVGAGSRPDPCGTPYHAARQEMSG